jgi:hypothetical protein
MSCFSEIAEAKQAAGQGHIYVAVAVGDIFLFAMNHCIRLRLLMHIIF